MTRTQIYLRFRAALSKGVITRAKACENCGATEREASIMGHHEDYSLPLVVTWLCGSCHQKLHYMKDPGRAGRMSKTQRETRHLSRDDLCEYYRRRRNEAAK